MTRRREIGKHRREEIIHAAASIIAEQGIQNLSLSAIEEKADMSRGQLTYYFRTKEDILLAVFDHMIAMMQQQVRAGEPPPECHTIVGEGWEKVKMLLTFLIVNPPSIPEFHALQYTFLSQISHRDDFRQRLASLYEHWRTLGTEDFGREMPVPTDRPVVSARTVASFMQAILHGLAIQRVADPESFDPQEMLTLTLHVLGNYLGKEQVEGETPAEPLACGSAGASLSRGIPSPVAEGEVPAEPLANGSVSSRKSRAPRTNLHQSPPTDNEAEMNTPPRRPSRSTNKE